MGLQIQCWKRLKKGDDHEIMRFSVIFGFETLISYGLPYIFDSIDANLVPLFFRITGKGTPFL